LVASRRWAPDTDTDWPTDCLSHYNFVIDFDFEFELTLNGRNVPLINSEKQLGVNLDKKITWRLHIETIEAKAFTTFIRIYPLFKSER
jgi:hypothetical protein